MGACTQPPFLGGTTLAIRKSMIMRVVVAAAAAAWDTASRDRGSPARRSEQCHWVPLLKIFTYIQKNYEISMIANRYRSHPTIYLHTTHQSSGVFQLDNFSTGTFGASDRTGKENLDKYQKTVGQINTAFLSQLQADSMYKEYYKNDPIGFNTNLKLHPLPVEQNVAPIQMPEGPSDILQFEAKFKEDVYAIFGIPASIFSSGGQAKLKEAATNQNKQFYMNMIYFIAWLNHEMTSLYNVCYDDSQLVQNLSRFYDETDDVSGIENQFAKDKDKPTADKPGTARRLKRRYETYYHKEETRDETDAYYTRLYLPVAIPATLDELFMLLQMRIIPYEQFRNTVLNQYGPAMIPPFPNGIYTRDDKVRAKDLANENKFMEQYQKMREMINPPKNNTSNGQVNSTAKKPRKKKTGGNQNVTTGKLGEK